MLDLTRPTTAKMTEHARQRCAEMCVGTKRVKALLRNPSVNHVAREGRWIAMSAADPDIAVVYAYVDSQPVVITVLWRAKESYDRATFIPLSKRGALA